MVSKYSLVLILLQKCLYLSFLLKPQIKADCVNDASFFFRVRLLPKQEKVVKFASILILVVPSKQQKINSNIKFRLFVSSFNFVSFLHFCDLLSWLTNYLLLVYLIICCFFRLKKSKPKSVYCSGLTWLNVDYFDLFVGDSIAETFFGANLNLTGCSVNFLDFASIATHASHHTPQ